MRLNRRRVVNIILTRIWLSSRSVKTLKYNVVIFKWGTLLHCYFFIVYMYSTVSDKHADKYICETHFTISNNRYCHFTQKLQIRVLGILFSVHWIIQLLSSVLSATLHLGFWWNRAQVPQSSVMSSPLLPFRALFFTRRPG